MSELEIDTARVLKRWMSRSDERLTLKGELTVARWLVKTAIVLGFAELDARRFMDTPAKTAVPDITSARLVASGELPDQMRAGAARVDPGAPFLWGVGNATVKPTGPDRINSRAVNVAAFNLGSLQLWVVVPLVKPDCLELPPGVARLSANLRFGSLRTRLGDLDPTQVRVRYSDQASQLFFAALEQLSQEA
jgi:hypothetical protein